MTIEQMLAMLIEAVAKLTVKIDNLTGGGVATPTPNPTLPPVNVNSPPPQQPFKAGASPEWVNDAEGDSVAANDWWMKDMVAVKKGAYNKHYSNAHVVLGILGGDLPREYNCVVKVDKSLPWSSALHRIGDIEVGWKNGESYRYTKEISDRERITEYLAAGAPNQNSKGKYDNNGRYVNPDEWVGRGPQ